MESANSPSDTSITTHGVKQSLTSRLICDLAVANGFQLCGVSRCTASPDFDRFRSWANRGLAGEMQYLTDHRADIRSDPGHLLAGVRSIISLGMVYNGPEPYSTEFSDPERAWISRYAWGDDYHLLMRERMNLLAARLLEFEEFGWRACVDTAPLLERSFGREAGLGWIGRNTCLINERIGSWFFIGELLTTLDLEPTENPAPDRCGTCSRCIDACPTQAIVPSPDGRFEIDARLCISYFTIELRGAIPAPEREKMGANVFGCDICQDVCPWNSPRRAAQTGEAGFRARDLAPPLERFAAMSQEEFRALFRNSPISRAKYSGFLRNVALAMGNSGLEKFVEPLERLAVSEDPIVAEHARWALARLRRTAL